VKIKTGREEVTAVRDLQIKDLWHLAQALRKVSANPPEEGDPPLMIDGEEACAAVLEVWHLAHSSVRALQRIEGQLTEVLAALDSKTESDGFCVAKARELVQRILEPGE
jgi:hypothetical protein